MKTANLERKIQGSMTSLWCLCRYCGTHFIHFSSVMRKNLLGKCIYFSRNFPKPSGQHFFGIPANTVPFHNFRSSYFVCCTA